MHVPVQPTDLVVGRMPDEILDVKDGQRHQRLPDELPESWSNTWHGVGRNIDPLGDGEWQNIEDVIPEGQPDGLTYQRPVHLQITYTETTLISID